MDTIVYYNDPLKLYPCPRVKHSVRPETYAITQTPVTLLITVYINNKDR